MNSLAPVILIHGMWSTPDTLLGLKYRFEDNGYRVYVPRLPGHLEKEEMSSAEINQLKSFGVSDYVESLSVLIESLNEPPILVGHSLGGLLAQLLAAKHNCKKLVLLSSLAPAGINIWSWSVLRTLGHNVFKFPLWKFITDLNYSNIRYGIANSQSRYIHQQIATEASFESGRVFRQVGMWFLYKRPVTAVSANKIDCPILVVAGEKDKITSIKVQRNIASKYSQKSTLIEISGACHWTVGGTYFDEVCESVFYWLDNESAINKKTG